MPQSVELFRLRKNLLILRTFSKVYGMAGIRVGYGIGAAALVSAMNKLRTPFNVSGGAQAAGLAALDGHEIGRAAGRGRGEISVGGGSFKKKKKMKEIAERLGGKSGPTSIPQIPHII